MDALHTCGVMVPVGKDTITVAVDTGGGNVDVAGDGLSNLGA
jgi:hypothetical protein